MLITVFNYASADGVTLALVRKVRMLVWTAPGVFFLARRGLSARLDVPPQPDVATR
jgi:hypothetical protein